MTARPQTNPAFCEWHQANHKSLVEFFLLPLVVAPPWHELEISLARMSRQPARIKKLDESIYDLLDAIRKSRVCLWRAVHF